MASQSDKTEYRQLRDTIYTFFYYSNKPAINTEIYLQFKSHKKPMIDKVLEDLVEKKKIVMKLFGKSKIFYLSQDMSFEIDEKVYTDEIDDAQDKSIEDKTLRYLKWNTDQLLSTLSQLKDENKELDAVLNDFENQMSVEELKRGIKEMKAIIKEDEGMEKEEVVDPSDFEKVKKEHQLLKKELAKKLGLFKEIVESITDGLSIKKKDFIKTLGIDE